MVRGVALLVICSAILAPVQGWRQGTARAESPLAAASAAFGGYSEVTVERSGQFAYVVFHALDRDGFCDASLFDAISLHPVLTGAPNDSVLNPVTGQATPLETVDFIIDSGAGVIIETSGGARLDSHRQSATGVSTFSTYDNAQGFTHIRAFEPLAPGVDDECQAWIKIASGSAGRVNVLVIVHDDLGDLGFDRVIDFSTTTNYTLTVRWSLITWGGADGIDVSDALKATGANAGGTNIFDRVTAVYGWRPSSAKWVGFFPGAQGIPGANDLVALAAGRAYWIAIAGQEPVLWKVVPSPN
jgi:hypothetical protein